MKKLLVCLAVSTILFTGCSLTQKGEGIIKVNGHVITQGQFDKELDLAIDNLPMLQAYGGKKSFVKSDENPMYSVFKEKIINELIIKSLLDEEIEKRGIKATKEDIQEELKKVIDKVGSKEELNRMLKQRGVSNDKFTEDLKTQVKMRKLIDSIEKIEISDADAQKFYNEHPKDFTHGEQVRASHILVATDVVGIIKELKTKNPNISSAQLNAEVDKRLASQKAKAEAILAEVQKNPDDFAKIASQKSDDKGSAARGGELGYFTKEVMVPEFAKAAFAMKPNTISGLVQTNYGYHIIKVTDRMEAGKTPFVKVKDDIKFYLETQKQVKVLKNFTSGLMKNADIEYLNDNFNPAKLVNVTPEPVAVKKEEAKK